VARRVSRDPSAPHFDRGARPEEQLAIFEVSSEGKPPQQEAIHFEPIACGACVSGPDVSAIPHWPFKDRVAGWT